MFFKAIAGPAATAASRSCNGAFLRSSAMPLRARVLAPKIASRAQMSTATPTAWAPPDDEPEDVVFSSLYGLRTIELNRAAKLNSLNGSMIRKIALRLLEWEKSDMANVVVMKGAGDKAFCAGGDVAAIAVASQAGPEGQKWSSDYFAEEYKLDHLIATYRKPYIAFMDGITMGGGVGLSIHAPFRIATERTVFAMPETTIGFFPDVGASFFLPRMPGAVGTYLALTSERLSGPNVFYAGVATHYLHSTNLINLEHRLAELRFKDYDSMDTRLGTIAATIEEFCTGLPHDQPILIAGELRKAIDRCFGHDTVPEIISALRAEETAAGASKEWAAKTLDTLHKRSPTAVHVSLRQLRIAASGRWTIAQTFAREHQLAARFLAHPDFAEGVSARLVRKPPTTPEWQPPTLEDVQPQDNITEPFFALSGAAEPLRLANERDFREYPFAAFGVPTERAVAAVADGTRSQRDVVNHFVRETKGKQGVKEIVEEIVQRKTSRNGAGMAEWIYDDS